MTGKPKDDFDEAAEVMDDEDSGYPRAACWISLDIRTERQPHPKGGFKPRVAVEIVGGVGFILAFELEYKRIKDILTRDIRDFLTEHPADQARLSRFIKTKLNDVFRDGELFKTHAVRLSYAISPQVVNDITNEENTPFQLLADLWQLPMNGGIEFALNGQKHSLPTLTGDDVVLHLQNINMNPSSAAPPQPVPAATAPLTRTVH